MKLIEIQRQFSQVLADKERTWSPSELGIRDQPPVAFQKRVGIYHYAYASRIGDSLKQDFEYVLKWLGDESFDSLVRPYLLEYPSQYQTLAEVSRHFPDFLQSLIQPGDPKFLPDLARLEWACICALVTDEKAAPSILPLTSLPEQDLEKTFLELSPSLELFFSEWPVDRLFKKQPSIVFRQTIRLAVYRGHHGLCMDRLRSRQWELLQLVASKASVATVLRWLESERVKPEQLQKWFATWATRGLLQGLRVQ